jgi:hypothetical protein
MARVSGENTPASAPRRLSLRFWIPLLNSHHEHIFACFEKVVKKNRHKLENKFG